VTQTITLLNGRQQAAIFHSQQPIGHVENPGVVRDHQHGAGLFERKGAQQLNDTAARGAVQGCGGFIRQQQTWMGSQSPGDGDPLLLPSGQVVGHLGHLVLEADSPQPAAGFIPTGPVTKTRKKIRPHLNVLLSGEATEQVVPLKDHADPASDLLTSTTAGSIQTFTENRHIP
jgi:hypothetical protein